MDKPLRIHRILQAELIAPGEVRHAKVASHEIAIFNLDGVFFATDDICTHMRARLSDGYVEDGTIQCPLHFGTFDIRTGKALSAPCTIDLRTYPIQIDDGWVVIELPV